MSAIIDLLTTIGNAFLSVIVFISSTILDILYVVKLTAEVVVQFPVYLSFLPDVILTPLLAIISVAVIYKILGRE